jgi:hypothetical protein
VLEESSHREIYPRLRWHAHLYARGHRRYGPEQPDGAKPEGSLYYVKYISFSSLPENHYFSLKVYKLLFLMRISLSALSSKYHQN